MIKNSVTKQSFIPFLAISIVINVAIFAYFLAKIDRERNVSDSNNQLMDGKRLFKIDDIGLKPQQEPEKMKKVGIKNGLKGLNQPDIFFQKLAEDVRDNGKLNEPNTLPSQNNMTKPLLPKSIIPLRDNNSSMGKGQFFFDPKTSQTISRSSEHESIKKQAITNINVPSNRVQQSLSGLEVRMERPEGVSEDELNDVEKMYYSFNVRMYKNFYTTIVTNFDKIKIQRPGLEKAMADSHELLGRVEYDENGEIQSIKILKSSVNDDIHFFFEESLKQLKLPNPPKSKLGKDKTFNIFYLITIN